MAQTGILVSIDHEPAGVIAISDPLKASAEEVISILNSMNVRSVMVTGDNWGTANSIVMQVGIEGIVAEAKPEQKAEKVKEFQAAEVGMAIGAGTDIAIEAPDIVLEKSNLKDVITAIDLSWKTFSRIRLNYMWALTSSVSQLLLGPSSPAQGSGISTF
ncbi:hypothetical protein CRG98_048013 [Punica granatum]|uniref:Cation-transporting P-type ATPase C-terminal domain-containing protein n=1 Tax=Punica granatum TaxID=22663 RepID=A0A2I0HIS6_PUNGR|nr:hypothetical protein CRG98_048013 [Punica granatum]